MIANIKTLTTSTEIALAFDVFLELRPHLPNANTFVNQVMAQQKEGYQLIGIEAHDEIAACVGFRFLTTLAWGKVLYIDDLITKEKCRGEGYAKQLLDYITQIAKGHHCDQLHLDSGYARHAAHKVYLKYGFELSSHHFALKLQ
ncbi:MAG: GNAT family N-acetyltransferase [Gammaproteobacteria bacterium]|nr:GNAT family N-acetyltransferase [Gammaproteobacteria bacterium]